MAEKSQIMTLTTEISWVSRFDSSTKKRPEHVSQAIEKKNHSKRVQANRVIHWHRMKTSV